MAIGVIWSPPIDRESYDAVKERVLQASLDAGLRFHAAGESSEGWRIGGQAPPMERPTTFEVYFEGP